MTGSAPDNQAYDTALAIVGMAGRFPGAPDIETFWQNIAAGVRSIRSFSDAELLAAGIDPELLRQPNYVKAGAVVDNIDHFDAGFFGYSPREAEIMDPQHRLFLECAWEALEHAAYNPETYEGLVGVFAGTGASGYALNNVLTRPDIMATVGQLPVTMYNEADSLASTVSYKLNLRGPSIAVQTFCSSSLVATHVACRSLLTYECDIALAGGVMLFVPHETGYLYQEGGIVSPDGHCRTFDAEAKGSVMGNGLGIVVLKRMEDALADGDQIYAVVRGSAVNNDGVRKVGYTAPGLAGQTAVILNALSDADVSPESINYIEAHGTATALGDAVELAAMINAFQTATEKKQFCALGSVKPNIGHLDRASGVTGLIKTTLALRHRLLPPSLDFERPSPDVDLAQSPFYVNTVATPWPTTATPPRAGVSSFGLGGTNAHVVLEAAPDPIASTPAAPWQLLVLSAKTATALDAATDNLARYLRQHPTQNLADVAYTLQIGRSVFNHRRAIVCRDREDALAVLEHADRQRMPTTNQVYRNRPVAFVFPGVGDHYVGMAQELYIHEPSFRATVDRCCALLQPELGVDLAALLFPADRPAPGGQATPDLRALLGRTGGSTTDDGLRDTAVAQPAVFVIEYALATLLQAWGVQPQALLGYSVGEYVAATLAGVLSLDDALKLVVTRARLIAALPAGAMLTVFLSEAAVQPFLSASVNLAVVTSPTTCVLAGPPSDLDALAAQLRAQDIACRPVATTHAFHSTQLAPLMDEVTALVRTLALHPPQIPYLSNVTGTWITEAEATDPTYWARHMVAPVRFADGVAALLATPEQVILEVGPGQALASFVKQHPACPRERFPQVISTLPAAHEHASDRASLLTALAHLWLQDTPLDWAAIQGQDRRMRLALPTYPFERQRFWVEPALKQPGSSATATDFIPTEQERKPDIADWFYLPSWKRSIPADASATPETLPPETWLLLVDGYGVGSGLAQWLQARQQTVILVTPAAGFTVQGTQQYGVRPAVRADYEALLRTLATQDQLPQHVVHLWSVREPRATVALEEGLAQGFDSLLALTQALGDQGVERCEVVVVSTGVQEVTGGEALDPVRATVLGPCKVIPQEYTTLTSRSIDLVLPPTGQADAALVEHLARELIYESRDNIVALRGSYRWVETFEPVKLPVNTSNAGFRQQGVYLITGGLGGIGLALAEHLATTVQAKLALVGRTALPPRAEWPAILATQDLTTSVGRRVAQVQALEARGIEVLVLHADVADTAQVAAAVAQTRAHFGTLHGVFHTAGVPGVGLMQLKTPEAAANVLAPKVQGTLALAQALRDIPLDFLVLFSSVTSATGGGPGQADYCAANAFLDAYARQNPAAHGRTLSISWGEWLWDAWQDGLQGFSEEMRSYFLATREKYGLTFAEGMGSLERILASNLPHVFVSNRDLNWMVEGSKRFSAAVLSEEREKQRQSQPRYPRPNLGTLYIAPRNDLERQIAMVWSETLGLEQIGIDDNFFELGGNSLLGIDLVARLRKQLKARELPGHILYDAPSVSTLAEYIQQTPQERIAIEERRDEDQEEQRQDTFELFRLMAEMEDL